MRYSEIKGIDHKNQEKPNPPNFFQVKIVHKKLLCLMPETENHCWITKLPPKSSGWNQQPFCDFARGSAWGMELGRIAHLCSPCGQLGWLEWPMTIYFQVDVTPLHWQVGVRAVGGGGGFSSLWSPHTARLGFWQQSRRASYKARCAKAGTTKTFLRTRPGTGPSLPLLRSVGSGGPRARANWTGQLLGA